MKYLRAIVSSEKHGKIYKKDFSVDSVFSIFTHVFVDSMIKTRAMNEGQFYRALIIPHNAAFQSSSLSVTHQRSILVNKKSDWLTLQPEEPVAPDQPLGSFTLDIFIVSQLISYRTDFRIEQLTYFWKVIDQDLQRVGVLPYQETLQRNLYALDDDQHDFEREEIQIVNPNHTPLIEFIESEDAPKPHLVFPQRFSSDFPIQTAKWLDCGETVDIAVNETTDKEASKDRVQILIMDTVLASIQKMARTDAQVEQGGTLVGNIYENAENNHYRYIVEITAHIPAEEAFANEVELRYTFESWQKRNSMLKKHFPEQRIVGWYHTHLDVVKRTYYIDNTHQKTFTTPLFFSQDDIFTHQQFFREKWYVAMVLDPRGNLVFYHWAGEKLKETMYFYLLSSSQETQKEVSEIKKLPNK
jgi:proteasome lid subunit RPN8/RPN11